jgi:hypothetical protein
MQMTQAKKLGNGLKVEKCPNFLAPISKANETQAKKVNSICQNFLAWTVVASKIFSFRFLFLFFFTFG